MAKEHRDETQRIELGPARTTAIRRHEVELGPLPALEWTGLDSGGLELALDRDITVRPDGVGFREPIQDARKIEQLG